MKLIITCMLAMACFGANAQTEGGLGNPLRYENVVKTDTTLKKSQLYSKTLEWFTKTFNSGKSVMQLQDADAGVVIGNFNFNCNVSYNEYMGTEGQIVHATVKISVKDGRIKYEIYDFYNSQYGAIKDGDYFGKGLGKGIRAKRYKQYQKDSEDQASMLQANIANYFTAQLIASKTDNW